VIQTDGIPSSGSPALEYRTLQDLVTDRIRAAIHSGELASGSRLQHDALARQFGVSRMPIREALRVLQSEGIIELRPHRGAIVVDLDPQEVAQIFEIRALLEARAAELAAPNLTDSDLATQRRLLEQMKTIPGEDPRWLELNHAFHSAMYPASGWRHLCTLIDNQRNVVQAHLRLATAVLNRAASAHDEHAAILQAAEQRDGPLLARLTAEHLRRTGEEVAAELARLRQCQPGSSREVLVD